MRRTWGVALLVLTLAGVGCSGAGDDDDDTAASGDDATLAAETTALAADDSDEAMATAGGAIPRDAASATGGGGSVTGSQSAAGTVPDVGTKVVRTADLRIEVEKGAFGQQLRSASALARTLGGFVQSSSTSSFEEGDASGEVTLRVPVDRFDDAMAQLTKLGTVESSAEKGEDVTDQLVDLEARVRALRAEEDALNALMAEAKNVNEVLSIRGTAVGIREQIEQLAAHQASLADRSSFSTIHVVLHEATASLSEVDPGDDGWSLSQAFDTAGDAGVRVVGSMIVVVGVALPLVPFALLGLYLARRRARVVTATEG